jgi:murein DD-endopeptidase MepM/ murein hydrolase activator NlpD
MRAHFLLTCARMPMPERESAILSEKPRPPSAARLRRWALGLSSVPLLGVVAAFGIAPDTSPERVTLERVVQNVPLPDAVTAQIAPEQFWREERIQRGDTVGSILARLQVDDPDAMAYLRSAKGVRSLYQLVPGRTLRAVTTEEGALVSLRYLHGDGTELVVSRQGEEFVAQEALVRTERELVMASGEIETSLFAATDGVGLSDSVAVELADIFSSEVDFHRDLRPGDHFSVVYEALYSDGEFIRTGRIVAAEFTNDGRVHRAVFFEDAQGHSGFYTPDGKNLRKSFLRSPLEFSRISSGFSTSRFHPLLGTWRAHKGVDYAAPVGARVKATGSGVVEFVGQQGGYGNAVILRHTNGRSTLYGHLSGFAKGMHAGRRVEQGDVIGYVGMTGLATGPHLHYEFRVDGVHQNPLRAVLPPGPSITRDVLAAFQQASGPLVERLELLRNIDLAMHDNTAN